MFFSRFLMSFICLVYEWVYNSNDSLWVNISRKGTLKICVAALYHFCDTKLSTTPVILRYLS